MFFHLLTKAKFTIPVPAGKNMAESAGAHGILNINQVIDGAIVHPNVGQLVGIIYHECDICFFDYLQQYYQYFISICMNLNYC